MRRSKHLCVFLVVLLGVIVTTKPVYPQGRRLRVAVYPFNQKNVEFNIQRELGGKVNYGEVAADMLLADLSAGVDIINRDQLTRIMEEQGRKYDEHFDPGAAAEFGKLLGVDAIITGSISALHVQKQTSSGVGGAVNAVGGIFGKKKSVDTTTTTVEARVELTAEAISTVTGQTLSAIKTDGLEKKQVAGNLDLQGAGRGNTAASTSNSGYDPYLRSALRSAVQKTGQKFTAELSNAPRLELKLTERPKDTVGERSREMTAKPAYVALANEVGNVMKSEGATLSFFLAPDVKVSTGEVLEVQRIELVTNPRTGKQVAMGQTLGTLKVTSVSGETAQGAYQGKPATDKDRVVKKP